MTRINDPIELTFLGTGTSTGVPQIGCGCEVCRSADPHDRRLRASALVRAGGKTLLIDPGPDFREQMLTHPTPRIDAVLITHSHYDHVGGIDDLRPFCHRMPEGHPMPVYCAPDVAADLHARVPYCFVEHPYPGAPTFALHDIYPLHPFRAAGVEVLPVRVMHWKLPILGFRIGPLAYVTDCKTMPDETVEALRGVDTLVINALRHEEHISHLTLEQALAIVARIRPRVAWLTHISDRLGLHCVTDPSLPDGVHLAYDGLTIRTESNNQPTINQ